MRSFVFIASVLALVACTQEGLVGSLKGDPGPGLGAASALAAGGASTCVRTSNGEARCWGDNAHGSLGIGRDDPKTSAEPLAPYELGPVKGLFAGELASCAIRPDGKLLCWGSTGLVGWGNTGTLRDKISILYPFVATDAAGDVARVAIGRYFVCVLTTAGEVRCFGVNDKSQLGLGNTDDQKLPTTVRGLDGPATSIAASMGGEFACATTKSGAVFCWGNAPLGIAGGDAAVVPVPKSVDGFPEPALEVAAGGAHACARLASGRVACWGEGKSGQLGDGKATTSTAPVLANVTDIVAIAAGRAHTCAVRTEGSVFCWGADDEGQAGATSSSKLPTIVVEGAFKARSVTCGLSHSCAWGEGSRVACWGSNTLAQLGPKEAAF